MLSLRFIVCAPQLLFAQYSHELLAAQGSSSKITAAFSLSPVNVTFGNTLIHNVEKRANENLVAHSL